MKLQNKILLGVLPVVIAAIAVVGILSLRLSSDALIKQVRNNTILMSEGYADEIQTQMLHYRRTVQGLTAEILTSMDIQSTLEDKRRLHPGFRHLLYTDPTNGKVRNLAAVDRVAGQLDLSDSPWWQRAVDSGRPTLAETSGDFGYHGIAITAPVLIHYQDGGPSQIQGVITGIVPLEHLFSKLNQITIGQTGHILVANRDGRILNTDRLADGEPVQMADYLRQRQRGELADAVTSGQIGWGAFETGDDEHFLAFAPIPSVGWSLLIRGDPSEFTADVGRISLLLVGLLLAAITIASSIIYLGVTRTFEPIRELTGLIGQVERGDFDVELEVSSDGEIGRLGRAFNHMTGELKRHRHHLEERVRERTSRISTINQDLLHEIEERQEVERALRESEKRYRTLIEQSVEGIYLVELDTWTVLDANPAFCELTGYSREEVCGRQITDFIGASDAYMKQARDTLRETGTLERSDGQWLRKDGEVLDVEVTATKIRLRGRDMVFVVGRDVTEQKRMEEKLELTDRLASLGTLAAGIAHEINNPLAFIITNLYFIEEEVRVLVDEYTRKMNGEATLAPEELLEVIEQSKRGADRLQKIVHDLRSFYRSDDGAVHSIDVRQVFDSVVGLATTDLPDNVELREDYGPVPMVEANSGTLGQVFLNILVNAIQALPEERAGRHDVIAIDTHTDEVGRAVIRISDTGEGIEPTVIHRIFDPFFTTKPVDQGTGLGLSMSHSIIHSFGGDIHVDSAPGEGATFTITLPPVGVSDLSASSMSFLENHG